MPAKKPSEKRACFKKPKDVERLVISKNCVGRVKKIGGYHYGEVYIGRMRFNDGSWHRVAVKRFKKPLSARVAKLYQKAIADLTKAGIALPKMGMVKMPDGEWVQVSQLFGSRARGSKIVNKSHLAIEGKRARTEAVQELTKVANAGYTPEMDVIEPFKKRETGAIPIDLDMMVRSRHQFGERRPGTRAQFLVEAIEAIAQSSSNLEYRRLCEIALETASPEMKKQLKRFLSYLPE
jgi:hypothetical protein